MRIVYMGTPDFAVLPLQKLHRCGHEIVGVFSQPDRPRGRGMKLVPTPVKAAAKELGLSVYQPESLKSEDTLRLLHTLSPQAIVVAAYGKILPPTVLQLPPLGCINLHASLLPAYRGAAPIAWCILNGERKTGVTTMYMAEGLDTGDMILQAETPIGENETADELHDRLSALGADLLAETLERVEAGTAPRTPQDDAKSSYAPMLDKSLSELDFLKPARQVHHRICGLSSWPCAATTVEGKRLKVYASRLCPDRSGVAGTLLSGGGLLIACGEGSVELVTVQLAGGKRMDAAAFLAGHPLPVGTRFGG